jgi:pathogenesis-related protein 1
MGVPPLAGSDRLAAHAQDWADTRAAASPAQAVDAWASESQNYDYNSNGCRGVCGHYTQMVWRDTKEVGCAVAPGEGREVWACNYEPPGNWVGKRPY